MDSIYTPKNANAWMMKDQSRPTGQTNVADLRAIAKTMDSQFSVGGFKFGWDGILGLIPGVGDVATSLVSFYIIIRAASLGAGPATLMRMGMNVVIDNVFDAIPVLGQIFDFFWKSNNKNMVLLERHLQNPKATSRASMVTVSLVLIATVAVMVGLLILSVMAGVWLFEQIRMSSNNWN